MATKKRSESAASRRLAHAGVKRLRYPLEVYESAQQLYNLMPRPTWTSMEIDLRRMYPDGSPSEGALRLWEKRGIITDDEEDAPWEFGSGEYGPEDDGLILDWAHWDASVNAAIRIHNPESRTFLPWRPSRRMARWVVHILRAVPELDRDNPGQMGWVKSLARAALGQPGPNAVALALALKPWRNDDALTLFTRSTLFDDEFREETYIAFTYEPAGTITISDEEDDDGEQ
jgi:hypothetical protein